MTFQTTTFKRLVTKLAHSRVVNSQWTPEDIEQECWEKLLKMHRDHEDFRKADRITQIKMATTALKRRIIDIVRYNARRPDTSDFVEDYQSVNNALFYGTTNPGASSYKISGISLTIDEEKMLTSQLEGLSEIFCTAEQIIGYQQIKGIIFNWARTQDTKTHRLVLEKIYPSESTLDAFDKKCEQYPRYKGYTSIPGPTLCDILGFERKLWYKTKKALDILLRSNGLLTA